jgi:hypothetical protein
MDIEGAPTQPITFNEGQQEYIQNLIRAAEAEQRRITEQQVRRTLEEEGKNQKIPDPDFYYGDQNKLKNWIVQLRMKIHGNSARFPTDKMQINYACSLLRGKALSWAVPYVEEKPGYVFQNMADFIEQIRANFGDPNPQATADQQIRNLRQGNKDCSAYHTQFTEYSTVLEWDDKSQISQFWQGLTPNLQRMLIGRNDIPTEFNKYAQLCIRLDNELRAYQQRNQTWRQERPRTQYQTSPRIGRSDTARSTQYTGSHAYHGPEPMELDSTHRKQKLSQEERKQRMDNRLCLYCAKPGHQVKDCRSTKNRRPTGSQQPNNQPRRNTSREIGALTKQSDHGTLSWTACYDDSCLIHKSEKDGAGWYPSKPRKQKYPVTDHRNFYHGSTSWRECNDDDCSFHEESKAKRDQGLKF